MVGGIGRDRDREMGIHHLELDLVDHTLQTDIDHLQQDHIFLLHHHPCLEIIILLIIQYSHRHRHQPIQLDALRRLILPRRRLMGTISL